MQAHYKLHSRLFDDDEYCNHSCTHTLPNVSRDCVPLWRVSFSVIAIDPLWLRSFNSSSSSSSHLQIVSETIFMGWLWKKPRKDGKTIDYFMSPGRNVSLTSPSMYFECNDEVRQITGCVKTLIRISKLPSVDLCSRLHFAALPPASVIKQLANLI